MRGSLGFWLTLSLCVSPLGIAQKTTSPPAAPATEMAASGTGNVDLDVVVTDNSGKPVAGLGAGDFTLLDNNQPARILSFHAHSATASTPTDPVEVAIVFDIVNTGFDAVSYTRQQVEDFLRQNGGHLAQPVALYFLTNGGVKAQRQPSTDGNALAQDLANATGMLRTINRSAGAWGATERVQFSAQMLGMIALSLASKPGRKLLIWAGPGWPLLDGPNLYLTDKGQKTLFQEIVAMNTTLREGRIAVYSIDQGTPGPETYRYQQYLKGVKKAYRAIAPNLTLKVIAVQSGGLVVPPENNLSPSINTCVQDATAYYTLSFDAPPADGPNEYHELKVRIGKPGLTARTNTGYYDQPAMTTPR